MDYSKLTDQELRVEIARRKGWDKFRHYSDRITGYHDSDEWGWTRDPVPDWLGSIAAAKSLTDEWINASAPNGGHHEVHISYEDMDGTCALHWWCALAQFTDDAKDYRWYTSDEQPTEERARCIAWLMWMDAKEA